jgi:hypothetical protein
VEVQPLDRPHRPRLSSTARRCWAGAGVRAVSATHAIGGPRLCDIDGQMCAAGSHARVERAGSEFRNDPRVDRGTRRCTRSSRLCPRGGLFVYPEPSRPIPLRKLGTGIFEQPSVAGNRCAYRLLRGVESPHRQPSILSDHTHLASPTTCHTNPCRSQSFTPLNSKRPKTPPSSSSRAPRMSPSRLRVISRRARSACWAPICGAPPRRLLPAARVLSSANWT